MFRIWGKIWKDNHLLQDHVYCNDSREMNRTRKVFAAIDEFCNVFDLPKPIWLDTNINDFKRRDRTRFSQDSFIEEVPFDYFEIMVIEEDDFYL